VAAALGEEMCGLVHIDPSDLWMRDTQAGRVVTRPFGALLLHVPNHATHHRSEIATMLTMLSGSPPDTGVNSYYREAAKA
jgi:uncharacterized damage-inducible protein DinB